MGRYRFQLTITPKQAQDAENVWITPALLTIWYTTNMSYTLQDIAPIIVTQVGDRVTTRVEGLLIGGVKYEPAKFGEHRIANIFREGESFTVSLSTDNPCTIL